jgi:hypothetical protein
MFYRVAIIKNDRNAKSVTLREMTKEQVEEMLPRIKSFLFPDEDASGYRHWIWENKIDSYGPGIKVPEFTVNVYRPVEKKKVEGFEDFEDDDWDVMEDGGGWFEEIVEADSLEEAREKVFSKACPYNSVGYDECHVYINEVPIATLLEEAKHSLISRVQNAYLETINPDSMTVREYVQIHREMEKSEDHQYRALRYMRAVFAHTSLMDRTLDLTKMSAAEFIKVLRELPAIDDHKEWERRYNELKAKYGKEEIVD